MIMANQRYRKIDNPFSLDKAHLEFMTSNLSSIFEHMLKYHQLETYLEPGSREALFDKPFKLHHLAFVLLTGLKHSELGLQAEISTLLGQASDVTKNLFVFLSESARVRKLYGRDLVRQLEVIIIKVGVAPTLAEIKA